MFSQQRIDILELGFTLVFSAKSCVHNKLRDWKSCNCMKKVEKIAQGDRISYCCWPFKKPSSVKMKWMLLLYGKYKICAVLLLVLNPVSFNHTQYVSPRWLVYIQDGSTTLTSIGSRYAKRNPFLLRIWSLPYLNELGQLIEMRAMLALVHNRKIMVFVWKEFAIFVSLFSKVRVSIITLSLSRNSPVFSWCQNRDGKKRGQQDEINRVSIKYKDYWFYWGVRVQVVLSLYSWCISKKFPERKISSQMSWKWRVSHGMNYPRASVCFCSKLYWRSWTSATLLLKRSSGFQIYRS